MIEAKELATTMNIEPLFPTSRVTYRKRQFDESTSEAVRHSKKTH